MNAATSGVARLVPPTTNQPLAPRQPLLS